MHHNYLKQLLFHHHQQIIIIIRQCMHLNQLHCRKSKRKLFLFVFCFVIHCLPVDIWHTHSILHLPAPLLDSLSFFFLLIYFAFFSAAYLPFKSFCSSSDSQHIIQRILFCILFLVFIWRKKKRRNYCHFLASFLFHLNTDEMYNRTRYEFYYILKCFVK